MRKSEYNSLDDIPDLLLLGDIDGIQVPLFLTADQARIIKRACKVHRKTVEALLTDLANESLRR